MNVVNTLAKLKKNHLCVKIGLFFPSNAVMVEIVVASLLSVTVVTHAKQIFPYLK